tara:strand:- start:149 stop:1528 length:1380 start_codon:yes stop_codon:yes gene_type:complete
MDFDALLMARIQFAFTISFHILFPAFTIGLAGWLAVLEALWLNSGEERYYRLLRFWTPIFALSFGMGVVSGIVLSYEFGTNWSGLTEKAGDILGPLLSYEVMTAFFLEAGFLGIMLFGWARVPRWLHFTATLLVATGTLISAFWILSANSFMQTPAGFRLDDGILRPEDWWAIVFNPSFPYRFIHMVTAAYLTTAFVVAGVGAWYLLERRFEEHARTMLKMSLAMIVILAPLQIAAGDQHGLNVRDHQPAKLAAIEANWKTQAGMPLVLFAIPDMETESNRFEVGIPKLGSLIITHDFNGVVRGLKDFSAADRPNVPIVFWAFRIMVGIGFVMFGVALVAIVLAARRRLYDTRWFLHGLTWAAPLGFIAIIAGWVTAEVGRQPWVIYGQLRTADALSPVPAGNVALSLALFVLVYGVVFGAGFIYIWRSIRRGPLDETAPPGAPPLTRRPMAAVPTEEN